MPPPPSMRATESLSSQEVIDFTRGVDADYFLGKRDYATYIQMHLMPPLTGTRAHAGRTANAPSTSRAREPRGRARGVSSVKQGFDWLAHPTELTCWRHTGEAYQIPIEPASAGHRYVRAPDSPPAPTGYVEGLLEMLASFDSMILRREALLGFYNIQVLPIPMGPAAPAAPAPAVPPLTTKRRERQAPARGQARRRSRD